MTKGVDWLRDVRNDTGMKRKNALSNKGTVIAGLVRMPHLVPDIRMFKTTENFIRIYQSLFELN